MESLGNLNFRDLVAHPPIDADLSDLKGMADRDRRPTINDDPLPPGNGDELAPENEGPDEADPPTTICPHRLSSRRVHYAARSSPATEFWMSAKPGRAPAPFGLVIARKLRNLTSPRCRSARRVRGPLHFL